MAVVQVGDRIHFRRAITGVDDRGKEYEVRGSGNAVIKAIDPENPTRMAVRFYDNRQLSNIRLWVTSSHFDLLPAKKSNGD